jgi:hypothetical protein
MAQIIITIPDAYSVEVANAFVAKYGPLPANMTKEQFVTYQCRLFVKQTVCEVRQHGPARTAMEQASALVATVEADWKA